MVLNPKRGLYFGVKAEERVIFDMSSGHVLKCVLTRIEV